MAKSTQDLRKHNRTNKVIEWVMIILLVGFAVFALTACNHMPTNPGVTVKSKLDIAVDQIKPEWLKRCPPLPPPPTTNSIGALLEDASNVLPLAAECAARHNSFVDYFAPVVNEHRGN